MEGIQSQKGTVFEPLLFLVYINDLPDNIHSPVRLLADCCVLFREIKNSLIHKNHRKTKTRMK